MRTFSSGKIHSSTSRHCVWEEIFPRVLSVAVRGIPIRKCQIRQSSRFRRRSKWRVGESVFMAGRGNCGDEYSTVPGIYTIQFRGYALAGVDSEQDYYGVEIRKNGT